MREGEERVQQAMRLKFGRVVDLDRLEGVATNRTVEELRAKLRTQEAQHTKQLADLQVSLTVQDTISRTVAVPPSVSCGAGQATVGGCGQREHTAPDEAP